jgi:hypothetical protein
MSTGFLRTSAASNFMVCTPFATVTWAVNRIRAFVGVLRGQFLQCLHVVIFRHLQSENDSIKRFFIDMAVVSFPPSKPNVLWSSSSVFSGHFLFLNNCSKNRLDFGLLTVLAATVLIFSTKCRISTGFSRTSAAPNFMACTPLATVAWAVNRMIC